VENDIWSMLNESEQELMREVEPRRLRDLDEEELVALHKRVRRARNKYAKNYRRGAAAQVAKDGSRAKASKKFRKTARKAEAFEQALANVSTRLAKVAKQRAYDLKAERLSAAGRHKGAPAKKRASRPASSSSGASEKRKRRTPAKKRASAQAKSSTKRHQAKRAAKAKG
jgi:hypothetical protein